MFTQLMHRKMQNPRHNLQNMDQGSRLSEFLKKLTQFTLSFSLFSFLLLHPSWLFFLLRAFISHFSTTPSQFLSHASDKNYIFLLCNGILVFIAKYSTRKDNTQRPIPSETVPDNDMIFEEYTESLHASTERSGLIEDVTKEQDEGNSGSETNEVVSEEVLEEKIDQFLITDGTQRGNEDEGLIFGDSINDDDKENMKKESENESYDEEAEEEEEEEEKVDEEEEIAKMSTEELNRKFEDFIRKMKEELRFEAQQQLIMV